MQLDVVEVYTPATNSWSTHGRLPSPRKLLAGVASEDGTLYALGGWPISAQQSLVALAPGATAWKPLAPMPTPRTSHCAAVGPDGRVYAVGGDGTTQYLPTVEVYTP